MHCVGLTEARRTTVGAAHRQLTPLKTAAQLKWPNPPLLPCLHIPLFYNIHTMAESAQPAGSWTDAFPAPQATAPVVSREEVVSDISSPDLLLVDVRRTDYEGGTIKGSINLPAHSFYLNRAVLYDLCKRAGVKKVAFYCGKSWLS